MSAKVLVIVILYHPKREVIEALLKDCLAYAGCDVFLSDNADFVAHDVINSRVIYHPNGANVGLGGAQNIGLKYALENKYDYAVLFDQDSQISADFLGKLVEAFERVRQSDPKIIAAGPSDSDPRLPPVVRPKNEYKRMIIASGCIIALVDLPRVGLMDEILFIDYVDKEWCYRARKKGYAVMQLSDDVKMLHPIGEVKQLKSGKYLKYHSYGRYYYFFRNTVIMVRRKYISWKHILKLRTHLYKIPYLDHKWKRLTLAFKGLWDGMTIKL